MGSADADVRRRRLRWYPVPAWFGVVLVLTAINVVSAFFGGPHVGSHSQIAVWDVAVVAASVAFQMRAHRASRPAVEVSPTPAPRFELNAPDPAPGQCPVCGLDDLDELGVHDEMAREIDPGLVRVVGYGPYRAHYACAAVVPYVAPDPHRAIVRALQGRDHAWSAESLEGKRDAHASGGHPRGFEALGCPSCAADRRTVRDLPATGSQCWESWREHGFTDGGVALDWYRHGFTPWHAKDRVALGFARPSSLPAEELEFWSPGSSEAQDRP